MTTENRTPRQRPSRSQPTATVTPQDGLPFENPGAGEPPWQDEDGQAHGQDETALAVMDSRETGLAECHPTGYIALDMAASNASLMEAMNENLGGEGISSTDLERVKLPAGGARYWTMETSEGQETAAEIQGIIIYHERIRAYWTKPIEEPGGSMQPDCSSADGKTGQGTPGGDCAACPLNAFGSARNGRGKACQEKQLLYVLLEDRILPIIIQVPATSLRQVHQYMVNLVNSRDPRPYWQVVTSFQLETIKAEPFPYSRIITQNLGALETAQAMRLRAFRENLLPKLRQFAQTNLKEIVSDFSDFSGEFENSPAPAGAVIDQDGSRL